MRKWSRGREQQKSSLTQDLNQNLQVRGQHTKLCFVTWPVTILEINADLRVILEPMLTKENMVSSGNRHESQRPAELQDSRLTPFSLISHPPASAAYLELVCVLQALNPRRSPTATLHSSCISASLHPSTSLLSISKDKQFAERLLEGLHFARVTLGSHLR